MIYFLVNGNDRIGSGHFRRCLNIAIALDSNRDYMFVSWDMSSVLTQELSSHSIKHKEISYDALLYLDKKIHLSGSMLIVDTDDDAVYTLEFQRYIRSKNCKLMIITINDLYYYECDLLLNQSILALHQSYKVGKDTKSSLGRSILYTIRSIGIKKWIVQRSSQVIL